MLSHKRHLAGWLLTNLMMVWGLFHLGAMSGCLLPQEDRILDPVPPKKNRPPRILEEQATPTRFITTNNGANCRLDFSFKVEDQDVDDLLTLRWYVDYFDNPAFVLEDNIPVDGKPQRGSAAVYTVDFDSAVGTPLRQEGFHLVEGLVSDGRLVNRTPQDKILQDGTHDPTYAVTYAWMVKVESGPCSP